MRSYTHEGKDFPSVTTVIHILGNDRLMQWANIMGFRHKHISAILEESAEYGTYAHEIARSVVDPNAPQTSINIPAKHLLRLRNLEKKIRAFTREHELVVEKTEFEMISPKLEYGGTLDMFGSVTVKGVRYKDYILDWKTAKAVHSTMWLQMGGYFRLAKEYGMHAKGAGIIRINDDAIRINLIDEEELQKYSLAFLSLLDFYKFWGNRDN